MKQCVVVGAVRLHGFAGNGLFWEKSVILGFSTCEKAEKMVLYYRNQEFLFNNNTTATYKPNRAKPDDSRRASMLAGKAVGLIANGQ